MAGKIYLFLIIAIAVVELTVLVFYNDFISFNLQFSPENEDECKTILYSGKDSINLVFLSTEKQAWNYYDFFFQISPFKENKNSFNVFYVEYKPECELYKNKAMLCYSKELIKKASLCPADYIIAIDKYPPSIRSSAYMNVLSLNSEHPLTVFPHEFAHAFASLAEEYVPGEIPRNAKNCVSACEEFESVKDGCHEGCSKDNYFRSVDKGIMSTLSSKDYGIFDNNLIKRRIYSQLKITTHAIEEFTACENGKYVLIEAVYNKARGEIEVIGKSIQGGCAGGNGYGSTNYSLFDVNGNIVSSGRFDAEFIFTDAPENGEIDGETFENTRSFIIKVPELPDLAKIEIKNEDKTSYVDLTDLGARACRE